MKRILFGILAFTIMSATLYADGGKVAMKTKIDCCSKGCCNNCANSATVYAAKRGLIIHKSGTCTCC